MFKPRRLAGAAIAVGIFFFGIATLNADSSVNGVRLVSSPEQRAIRAYLNEYLDAPIFDEVRWWPVESTKGARVWAGRPEDEKFKALQSAAWLSVPADGKAVRLQYIKHDGAISTLVDSVFLIWDGIIEGEAPADRYLRPGQRLNP